MSCSECLSSALIFCIVLNAGICSPGFTLEQGIPHFNTKPYFLSPPKINYTALEGQSAYLHCRVAQLGDKKVSWIRRRDLHVLTSGLVTFASDSRFQALHQDRSENWTLHIRFSQIRDTGEYQCQVNTEPRISNSFYLKVEEASTSIEGSEQRYIKSGSKIYLKCETSAPSPQPGLLYWYKNSELIKENERTTVSTSFIDSVVSTLEVNKARESDSGNYTCWPTKFQPGSVTVHVIPGEKPAAMSDGTISNSGSRTAEGSRPSGNSQPVASRAKTYGNSFDYLLICINLFNLIINQFERIFPMR